jgi:hypothetical protein
LPNFLPLILQLQTIIDYLCELTKSNDEQSREVGGMAIKSIIGELAPTSQLAAAIVGRVTPNVVEALQATTTDVAVRLELLDILAALLARHAHITLQYHASVCRICDFV